MLFVRGGVGGVVVGDQVADGAEVVGQRPIGRAFGTDATDILLREQLINAIAPQVAAF